MPTADRSTLRAVLDEVLSLLRSNLVASPPTVTKPLRGVEVGVIDAALGPRPLMRVMLTRARPVATIDDDKVWEATVQLAVAVDLAAGDAHGGLLDVVGAVEDYLDALINVGVVEGANGFDDRAWGFEYPATRAGARVGLAKGTQTFVVRVTREANRVTDE